MQNIKIKLGKVQYSLLINGASPIFTHEVDHHCNANYELHIILSGSCIIHAEKAIFKLKRGEALLIAPNEYHSLANGSNDLSRIVLTFSVISKNSEGATDFDRLSPCTNLKLSDFELLLCEKIIQEFSSEKLFAQETANTLYTLLFIGVVRKIMTCAEKEKTIELSEIGERLGIIDNFFENNLAKNPTCEQLAKISYLSVRQLNRVLNKHYGVSFKKKLHQARIEKAELLLRTTDYTIPEICELIGYNSITTFLKAFKQQYKETPAKYRKKCQIIKENKS